MDAIFEAYLDAQRRRRASPLTVKAVDHALRGAQRWLDAEGIRAGELTLLQCEEYFDVLLDRGAVSTVRRHLAYVRAAYRYAVRHDLAAFDPTADVKLPRLPAPGSRAGHLLERRATPHPRRDSLRTRGGRVSPARVRRPPPRRDSGADLARGRPRPLATATDRQRQQVQTRAPPPAPARTPTRTPAGRRRAGDLDAAAAPARFKDVRDNDPAARRPRRRSHRPTLARLPPNRRDRHV